MSQITLYGGGPSRWVKAYWMLNELGVTFDKIDIFNNADARSQLMAFHPSGKVPVLVDGDFVLSESQAIVNFLAEKYPERRLIPKSGTFHRAQYDRWTSFVLGDLEQPLYRMLKHRHLYPEERRLADEITLAQEDFKSMARILETQITDHLVGNEFSAADIGMTYTLNWATWDNLLDGCPKLQAYLETHRARPSFPDELYVNLPV